MRHWLVATGILLIVFGSLPLAWPAANHPDIWLIFCIAAAPAFIVARINAMVIAKRPDDTLIYQLGMLFFRMLFSLMGLGAFLLLRPQTWDDKVLAVSWFFFGYLVYAAVEVKSFLSNLRRH